MEPDFSAPSPKMPNPRDKPIAKSAVHFNGNIFCVIDTETTGLRPGFHDVIQLAVIPLLPDITPNKTLPFFHAKIKPKRDYNWRRPDADLHASKDTLANALEYGTEAWTVVDMFDEWFRTKLDLPHRKQIVPLAQNWPFDREFLIDMFGWTAFHEYFHGHYRDLQTTCCFINDYHERRGDFFPFNKLGLKSICNKLGVDLVNAHDAMADALATAECYRRLLGFPV